jgi:uncharacterized protein (TIGR03437 family)
MKLGEEFMQRRLFSLTMLLLLVLVGAAALASMPRATVAQVQKPNVQSRTVQIALHQTARAPNSFTSEIIEVPLTNIEPFLAVGATWLATPAKVSLRGSVDGVVWSQWQLFIADEDTLLPDGEHVSALLSLDRQTRFVELRVTTEEDARVPMIRLNFISPGATPRRMRERIEETMNEETQQPSNKYPKPPIVTRTEWGCPDGQITTHGTLSYTTVTHLIVHHTFEPRDAPNGDWAAAVRSVWNFHVFSNGWADVGYNYLIDPNGVIYEGRAGGDNVTGAHFSGVNGNTMGVVLIGDFTSRVPTAQALASLKKILAWKADQRALDPTGQRLHAASGLMLNTISGHRDGPRSTECPGNAFYPQLPVLRADVKNLLAVAGTLASVSAASFKESSLASEAIVATFGTELAEATAQATSTPLPTQLAGTTVTVRDSANNEKLAPLFFVSAGQINFLMPAGLSNGPASIIVANGAGKLSRGTIDIAAVAPSLFAANANGRDEAAALILRVKNNGDQVYEPAAVFDQMQNRFVAKPIDLSNASEQVFLVAYGTGWRGRSSLSAVSALIGGVPVEVLFAGAAAGFSGLDQINLRLPDSLAGRGEVEFVLMVEGQKANTLKLVIH